MGWIATINAAYEKMEYDAGVAMKHDMGCSVCLDFDSCLIGTALYAAADVSADAFHDMLEAHPEWEPTT